ncbi:MAG TPA: branched chain amino acid aminotransferase, partial [Syntrophomonas sp.]|nr:branched chain amino acid aminotransferase [Syntrophomonas sp.]
MDYTEGVGWHDPRIIPYQPLMMDPATMVFHYGQAIFEGLKAYKAQNGGILLFRPHRNMARVNISNDRLCIPPIDVDFGVEAIKTLVSLEKDWIPQAEGTSLYIRPFIISTDPYLGVRPSRTYKFIIILCPVGAYYPEGINPVKIYIENKYVRAVKGGIGFAKTPGNYAASLKSQVEAQEKGYTQVLWLDGVERKYVEEVGTMNVFFKIDGKVITPSLEGSILAGITRDSSIALLKHWGVPVEERRISIEEIYQAHQEGKLEEAFGTGTAAVISPIGSLNWNDNIIAINNEQTGPISKRLYDTITGIQCGKIEDLFGWTVLVD